MNISYDLNSSGEEIRAKVVVFDDRTGDLNQDFTKYFGILKNISSEKRKYSIRPSGLCLVQRN